MRKLSETNFIFTEEEKRYILVKKYLAWRRDGRYQQRSVRCFDSFCYIVKNGKLHKTPTGKPSRSIFLRKVALEVIEKYPWLSVSFLKGYNKGKKIQLQCK